MKRVYVNEEWCLGCRLCEYNCAFANSGMTDMVKALKGKPIFPRVRVDGDRDIHFAVSCRHCRDPLCVKSCICGALYRKDGRVFAWSQGGKVKKFFCEDGLLKGYILIDAVDRGGIYTALIREQTPLDTVDLPLLVREPTFMAFPAQARKEKFASEV